MAQDREHDTEMARAKFAEQTLGSIQRKEGVEYIDITPSWEQVARMVRLYPDMRIEGRRALEEEFVRMGQLADKYMAIVKEESSR